MTAKLNTDSRSPFLTVAAATFATIAALATLWGVVALFQSRGAPLEHVVTAERACAHHAYRSEQEACMKQWLAESRTNWRTSAAR